MSTTEICNTEDYIDSREIINRIADLEAQDEIDEWEQRELAGLKKFADECNAEDWEYGVTLIRGTYFEDYARELAWDIGAVGHDSEWPATCINWGMAARELQVDYSCAELEGITYWWR